MRTLLLLSLALTSLACRPSQLDTSTISPMGRSLELSLFRTEEDECPVLEPQIKASINGKATAFSSRGGGVCDETELKGGSLLAFVPKGDGPPPKVWTCACKPAVLDLPSDDDAAAEVKICDGEICATASWAGSTPLPTVELARPVREEEPLIILFTPALPSEELYRLTRVRRGQGELSHSALGWSEGAIAVPPHPSNAQGLTVHMLRDRKLEPIVCEGFAYCSARRLTETKTVELRP
jgi:hypothetical protein